MHLTSFHLSCSNTCLLISRERHRLSPAEDVASASQVPHECLCPLALRRCGVLTCTHVWVSQQKVCQQDSRSIYIKKSSLANLLSFMHLELSSKEGVNHKVFHLEPCTLFIQHTIIKDQEFLLIILFFLLVPLGQGPDQLWINTVINSKLAVSLSAGENELKMQSNSY